MSDTGGKNPNKVTSFCWYEKKENRVYEVHKLLQKCLWNRCGRVTVLSQKWLRLKAVHWKHSKPHGHSE